MSSRKEIMQRRVTTPLPDTEFWKHYHRRSSGILHWSEVDALWSELTRSEGAWFVFDPAEDAPDTSIEGSEFEAFITKARNLVDQRRDRPMSGAVYVDDRESPGMIKVFDPVHMGTSCGCSSERVMPRWIFSRIKPDTLPIAPPPKTGPLAWLSKYSGK